MVCQNCGSENIEMTNKNTDGQGFWEQEGYLCNDCGEEWDWEMTKTITKDGEPQDEDEGD